MVPQYSYKCCVWAECEVYDTSLWEFCFGNKFRYIGPIRHPTDSNNIGLTLLYSNYISIDIELKVLNTASKPELVHSIIKEASLVYFYIVEFDDAMLEVIAHSNVIEGIVKLRKASVRGCFMEYLEIWAQGYAK